MRKEERKRD